jgi:4-hydroxy-2-oxoheptanedioate aldolase
MSGATVLRRKLRDRHACLGVWVLTTSTDVTEILAYAGLDFALLDHEHGQGSVETAIAQLRSLKGSDCAGLLRVPSNDAIYIKRALDAGVDGVMVPNVANRSEAEKAVAACRYPPAGMRGAFAGMRAMKYGFDDAYHGEIADRLIVALQIESAAAIDNVAEIAQVPGIDVLFIGPRDLSASLGRLNKFDAPEVQAEIARAEQAILKTGKILGSTAASGAVARTMAQRGYRFLIAGSDAMLLGQAAAAALKDFRQ